MIGAGLPAAVGASPPVLPSAATEPGGLTLSLLGILFVVAAVPVALSTLIGRSGRENIWLSLVCLCLGVNTLAISGWAGRWVSSPEVVERIGSASGHLAAAAAIGFLWAFLRRPVGPWLRAYQGSHLLLAAFVAAWPTYGPVAATAGVRFLWLLPFLVAAAYLVLDEARRGSLEARILSLSGLAFVAVELYELGHALLAWPRPGVSLVPFGFVAVLFSLWLAEAVRVRRNQQDLEELRDALEERVEERTRTLREERLRADRATRARDEFVFTLSHEVRNPLYSIIGLSEWLLTSNPPPLQRALVEMILGSGTSLMNLLDSVLDVSRLEAGEVHPREIPFDVRACLEATVDMAAPVVWDRGLELHTTVDPGVPRLVVGDGERVSEVLFNLLINAAKFTREGSVEVAVGWDGATGGEAELRFTVADTGPGILEEQVPHLFEPFWKESGSARGSGLGLAISRRLVEIMGGSIRVEARDPVGTAFHFTARVQVPSQEMTALLARRGRLEGRQALVVDPEARTRSRCVEGLQALGLHVKACGSVKEARRWLRGYRSVLVFAAFSLGDEEHRSLEATVFRGGGSRLIDLPREIPGCASDDALPLLAQMLACVAEMPAADDVAGPAKLRVLVVEDDDINLKVTVHLLQQLGQEPYTASCEEAAMALLAAHRYELVILDLGLGETDGVALARRIRTEIPAEDQPLLAALTGRADAPTRELCMKAGFDEFLTKPVDLHRLRALVDVGRSAARFPERREERGPAPVVDRQRIGILRELEDGPGDDLLEDLVHSFIHGSSDDLAAMLEAVEGDRQGLAARAHRLVGRSLNLGLERVAEACRCLESEAGIADAADLMRRLQELGRELDDAALLLTRVLAEPAGDVAPSAAPPGGGP